MYADEQRLELDRVSIMRCIFCLEEKPSSDEHVFPEAIGGTLHIYRVCKSCNAQLGSGPDAAMVNHPLSVMRRWQLGIVDKSGSVPDVFRQVFGTGRLANDPDQRVTVSCPDEGVKPVVKLVPRQDRLQEDGQQFVRMTMDSRDSSSVGSIIQKIRGRTGISPLAESDLATEVERILAGVQEVTNPAVLHDLKVDMIGYQRGILKIAYELAWYWLGDRYLEDPEAAKLREAIFDPAPFSQHPASRRIVGTISISANSAAFAPWQEIHDVHLGYAKRIGGIIGVAIRIFDRMWGFVHVSKSGDRYPDFDPSLGNGRFIGIDPKAKKEWQSTIIVECNRLATQNRL